MPSRQIAFFDVDGTLIADKSLLSFYRFFLEHEFPDSGRARYEAFAAEVARQFVSGAPRERVNAWFYATYFESLEIARLATLGERWFVRSCEQSGFFLEATIDALHRHRAASCDIVLVTGSCRELVAPLVRLLGSERMHCLMAPLEEQAGRYTGRLTGDAMIGEGKARAVRALLAERGVDPSACHGYGDDHTDIPFLELLGQPVAVASSTPLLRQHAETHGWSVLS
jgi:HAD superfamily hydrolase (TIGR01490 family)